jgi:hypothetical protein
LPDYSIPRFDGIGANEFIVDVTHELPGPDGQLIPAVDFLSTMDSDRRLDLNIWYHVLNCGFRPRFAGETDFPCFSGQRVGMGRTYVRIDGELSDDAWLHGLRDGRSYVSDGTCHLMDFRLEPLAQAIQCVAVGEHGSELRVDRPTTFRARIKAAVRPADGSSESLLVEAVVNGYPRQSRRVAPDGRCHDLEFSIPIERSSWVAMRAFPSAHTNPIFVIVGQRPIRGSRRSAEWCLRGVDQCWSQKSRFHRANELDEARIAYEHARVSYRRIRDQSPAD